MDEQTAKQKEIDKIEKLINQLMSITSTNPVE